MNGGIRMIVQQVRSEKPTLHAAADWPECSQQDTPLAHALAAADACCQIQRYTLHKVFRLYYNYLTKCEFQEGESLGCIDKVQGIYRTTVDRSIIEATPAMELAKTMPPFKRFDPSVRSPGALIVSGRLTTRITLAIMHWRSRRVRTPTPLGEARFSCMETARVVPGQHRRAV
jgi:hypothetical protein